MGDLAIQKPTVVITGMLTVYLHCYFCALFADVVAENV